MVSRRARRRVLLSRSSASGVPRTSGAERWCARARGASVQRYDGLAAAISRTALACRASTYSTRLARRWTWRTSSPSRGAAAGTLVLADAQTAGRGRVGRHVAVGPRRGYLADAASSGRATSRRSTCSRSASGSRSRRCSTRSPPSRCGSSGRTICTSAVASSAGILVEARWRDGAPEWVAIGVGINVRAAGRRDRERRRCAPA